LAFHGSLVLAKDLRPAPLVQLTALEIYKEIDFPSLKVVAGDGATLQLPYQTPETIEHQLQQD
jgi:hypothetical protein